MSIDSDLQAVEFSGLDMAGEQRLQIEMHSICGGGTKIADALPPVGLDPQDRLVIHEVRGGKHRAVPPDRNNQVDVFYGVELFGRADAKGYPQFSEEGIEDVQGFKVQILAGGQFFARRCGRGRLLVND